MTSQTYLVTRRYQRISPPDSMFAAWQGGGDQQVSRVQTLGMGGLFLCASPIRRVGTSLTLFFRVPGGSVRAEGVVRNVSAGQGMGVEFTEIEPKDRALLERLLMWLLH